MPKGVMLLEDGSVVFFLDEHLELVQEANAVYARVLLPSGETQFMSRELS